jgi:hypothetical protein
LNTLLMGGPLAPEKQQEQRAWNALDEQALQQLQQLQQRRRLGRRASRLARQPSSWGSVQALRGSVAGGASVAQSLGAAATAGSMCLSGYSGDLVAFAAGLQDQQRSQELAAGDGAAAAAAASTAAAGLGTIDSGKESDADAAGAASSSSAGGSGGGSGSGSGSKEQAGAVPQEAGELSASDYQRMLRERGLDCRGWNLVVVGHSLGAAVGALVGAHLRSWCPGEAPSGRFREQGAALFQPESRAAHCPVAASQHNRGCGHEPAWHAS